MDKSRTVTGAAPEGAHDRESAARAVREMFTSIAPRYDLLNHVLSCNIDRLWWRKAARTFQHILGRDDVSVLDLCCGTGDMTQALLDESEPARHQHGPVTQTQAERQQGTLIIGADFSHAMLQRASNKSAGTRLRWTEADALQLPFGDAQFDLITAAFGFRNLADYDAGLREIVRVLRPGGECGLLDFGEPKGWLGSLYRLYFKQVLPRLGTAISGVTGPYAYLPRSVERFPEPEEMLGRMRAGGFQRASWTPYTFGIAGLYRGWK